MDIQYIFVSVIVIGVIVWQIISFIESANRIDRLKNSFPKDDGECVAEMDNDVTRVYSKNAVGDFKGTLDDINSYLSNNRNKTFDYQVIKEIVSRRSMSLEEEVDTMLSAPLYLGLIATILGIAIGVIMFAWKDLSQLLSGSAIDPDGIRVLLTDVGIAMGASFAGVLATKISTSSFNEARAEMSRRKNRFLTWIQTDLMSKLSDDFTGAILKMTNDLNEFNRTFSQNTQELRETLSTVNNSYEGQVALLQSIESLRIADIAKANIEVYDRLSGCTEELERLFVILSNSESYVQSVIELNGKLGTIEERTRLFEELGNYFKNEIEYVKDRQGMMRQHISGLDSVLQDAMSNMGDSVRSGIQGLVTIFQAQNQGVQRLIEDQQRALTESLAMQQQAVNEQIGHIENPFDGVREIFDKSLKGITEAFSKQNDAVTEMLESQTIALEAALTSQQEAILQKLKEAPNQLQALTDIAKAVDKLNASIMRLENHKSSTMTQHPTPSDPTKEEKGFKRIVKSIFVPLCAGGSFLILLAMLLLMLYGGK
ncbi:MAG: hypothetical protein ACI30M_04120 [Muribaculaceae bacterium]